MKITFIRNGRIWENNQNGKKEEILDVYPEGEKHKHYRGMCNDSFAAVTGIILKPKESVTLKLEIVANNWCKMDAQ